MVKYETDFERIYDDSRTGIIVADLSNEGILNAAVSVLWSSGELVERVPHRILEVINESR
jgi:hypothetical protein